MKLRIKESYEDETNYVVKKKAYYDPAEDIDYLFYDIGGNTIPNIEQKLRQAGWITGYDIYVPKGTQLKNGPDRRVVGYRFETLQVVGGPLDGLLIPFMRDDIELCADIFIRRYCKRI